MRTTLKIDEDVLKAARELAGDESVGVGKVVSRLARRGPESGQAVGPRRRLPSATMPRVLATVFSIAAGSRASLAGLVFLVLQLLFVPLAVVVIVRIAAGLSPF